MPSQDIILGLYYLSLVKEKSNGEGMIFSSVEEVLIALDHDVVDLQASIKLRIPVNNGNDKKEYKTINTTPGRAKISNVIPKHASVDYEIVNKLMTKKEVTNVIDFVYRHCGQKETVIFCDKLMALGFNHACISGISFGITDLETPKAKADLVSSAEKKAVSYTHLTLPTITEV